MTFPSSSIVRSGAVASQRISAALLPTQRVQTRTITSDPNASQMPLPGKGEAGHAFAGVPATVTTRLRGPAPIVAAQGYFDSLTSPGVGAVFVQHPRYGKTFGAHPSHRTQPLPPGSVDATGFLQGISRDNDGKLRTELARWQGEAPAAQAAQLDALHARLLTTPLQIKHFAEPGAYARHEAGGRHYWHLVSDPQKTAQGQAGAMGQSMDANLFNLERFVYFSIEPQGCGPAGKTASRFGQVLYSVPMESIHPQLIGASLFTRDFATQPPQARLALFRSTDGSTGDPALDACLQPGQDGSAAAPVSDEVLTETALAAGEHRARAAGGQRPISNALSVYRYAAEPCDIHPPLALAVTHQTAMVLAQCGERLQQLRAGGQAQSPAAALLTQLTQRVEHSLAQPDDPASQNFLMNHIGVRPQLIVPSTVVLPA